MPRSRRFNDSPRTPALDNPKRFTETIHSSRTVEFEGETIVIPTDRNLNSLASKLGIAPQRKRSRASTNQSIGWWDQIVEFVASVFGMTSRELKDYVSRIALLLANAVLFGISRKTQVRLGRLQVALSAQIV